ncbi:phosphatase and actin regulator 3-like isoform X2 [Acipenser ruthenus]|nr:phosphatase and actin regulator 3-like isoform X2 [Acipenser ruthenus]XP_034761141.2 phosphatase and actin regulator 3-like isoform X2 [Acipenser ruthenus]XP_034761142.2 phosphatase and actin regulator 3-like isoform X2 [Acipenser ruthenus]
MDQQRALHSGCLVSGVRTPPIRRNSKLATLGRIFKPWKWRKKKNDKLKQNSTALERKVAARQSRDELVRKGLAEMMEQDSDGKDQDLACGVTPGDPDTPTLGSSDAEEEEEEEEGMAPLVNLNTLEDMGSDKEITSTDSETVGELSPSSEDKPSLPPPADDSPENQEEGDSPTGHPSPPPAPGLPAKFLNKLGGTEGSHSESAGQNPLSPILRNSILPKEPGSAVMGLEQQPTGPLRGQHATPPTGSPHMGIIHPPLPPSCIIEELHRALAIKHRQDSFLRKEMRPSPKRRSEGRLSRTSSTEREPAGGAGVPESKQGAGKDSDENKENERLDECRTDASGLPQDQDSWNDSIISGTLPRRMHKELLTVKLRNRPSKQELEDRNIFPVRSDEERQEIRQQIELKLSKRLSQRPAVEELESRNILKQRNDQIEQEERREIKQRLNRKLNQRPTVDELRDRKILIRFSDYVEVAKAQDYDRRADKPWTRLSAADKAAIRKELNEYKSNEMQVHASSKHLTRFHRP